MAASTVVGASSVESRVNTLSFAVPSASNCVFVERVRTPARFVVPSTLTAGGPAELVTVRLLNVVVALPWINCVEVPLNVTVPEPLLKVLLFVKSPVRLRALGPLSVPEIKI
jgi:hypothetical protein